MWPVLQLGKKLAILPVVFLLVLIMSTIQDNQLQLSPSTPTETTQEAIRFYKLPDNVGYKEVAEQWVDNDTVVDAEIALLHPGMCN